MKQTSIFFLILSMTACGGGEFTTASTGLGGLAGSVTVSGSGGNSGSNGGQTTGGTVNLGGDTSTGGIVGVAGETSLGGSTQNGGSGGDGASGGSSGNGSGGDGGSICYPLTYEEACDGRECGYVTDGCNSNPRYNCDQFNFSCTAYSSCQDNQCAGCEPVLDSQECDPNFATPFEYICETRPDSSCYPGNSWGHWCCPTNHHKCTLVKNSSICVDQAIYGRPHEYSCGNIGADLLNYYIAFMGCVQSPEHKSNANSFCCPGVVE